MLYLIRQLTNAVWKLLLLPAAWVLMAMVTAAIRFTRWSMKITKRYMLAPLGKLLWSAMKALAALCALGGAALIAGIPALAARGGRAEGKPANLGIDQRKHVAPTAEPAARAPESRPQQQHIPTPANWYPDPSNPLVFRWWDGRQWTNNTQPRR